MGGKERKVEGQKDEEPLWGESLKRQAAEVSTYAKFGEHVATACKNIC